MYFIRCVRTVHTLIKGVKPNTCGKFKNIEERPVHVDILQEIYTLSAQ